MKIDVKLFCEVPKYCATSLVFCLIECTKERFQCSKCLADVCSVHGNRCKEHNKIVCYLCGAEFCNCCGNFICPDCEIFYCEYCERPLCKNCDSDHCECQVPDETDVEDNNEDDTPF